MNTEKSFLACLSSLWFYFNKKYLSGVLEPPVFKLSHAMSKWGSWNPEHRELMLSFIALDTLSELEVGEILRHEMAHQYVDEVLRDSGKPHGGAFAYACRKLDIHHKASTTISDPAVMEKIQKCLQLGCSSNVHEAELALKKAHQLMEKYGIETAAEKDRFVYEYIGSPRKQKSTVEAVLLGLLCRHFHVQALWIPTTRPGFQKTVWIVEICGLPHHIKIARYVYDYLQRESEMLWRNHRSSSSTAKGKRNKIDFQVGILNGFSDSLNEPFEMRGRELVQADHHDLLVFQQSRHRHISRQKGKRYYLSDAYKTGEQAGKNLKLRNGVEGQPKNQILGIPSNSKGRR